MDKRLGTNLHFGRSCAHTRCKSLNFTGLTSPLSSIQHYYLQFRLIFNIVLGWKGESDSLSKGKRCFSIKTQIIRKITEVSQGLLSTIVGL